MKIPGSDGSDSVVKRLGEGVNGDKTVGTKPGVRAGVRGDGTAQGSTGQGADSVNVSSLGALLKSELDPTKMAAERQAKLEALKQQIKDGTYQPPADAIAKSISQELSLEILLGGGKTEQEDAEFV